MSDARLPLLGDLEHAIMDVVWSRSELSVREVLEALRLDRRPAYTTVMTVMNRLVQKGMLKRKSDGQSFHYSPATTKAAYLERTSRQVVSRFIKAFGDVAIAQFIDVLDDVDPKKLAALRRQLRREDK